MLRKEETVCRQKQIANYPKTIEVRNLAKCELCGKTTTFGKSVSHRSIYVTGRCGKKVYPNLKKTTVAVNGVRKKLTVCTRCLRTSRKTNLQRQ